MNLRDLQKNELLHLLETASETEFGKRYDFSSIEDYKEFSNRVPLSFYSDISQHIEQHKKGTADIYWPGTVSNFAVSAGTSGKGKHLPLTEERLQSDKRYMRKLVWSYVNQRPNFFRLMGRHVSLPGTMEKEAGFDIGEISAFTARQVPWWLSFFQLIPADELIKLPFDKKLERVINEAVGRDIRVISAVPSWLLSLFQRVLQKSGADSVIEIWPNLCLLVCGGVKLSNYRPYLEKLLGTSDIDFIETYGASEGYFSFTDNLLHDDMKLVIDNGIFYEFIRDPLPDTNSLSIQETIPLWEVEPGIPYAILVTTNAGLWRYALNDIITFTQTDPPRIEVLGRVNEMLDDYGEALYSYEAETAINSAAEELDITISAFTISATLEEERELPRHLWFVQTTHTVHRDTLKRLAKKIDAILQQKNRHYSIRRNSSTLDMPEIFPITQQQINRWLEQNDKAKAQGKLPSILHNQQDIDFFRG